MMLPRIFIQNIQKYFWLIRLKGTSTVNYDMKTICEISAGLSVSPFRLRRRIGPRPAFIGVDATVKVERGVPFCRARAEVRTSLLPSSYVARYASVG